MVHVHPEKAKTPVFALTPSVCNTNASQGENLKLGIPPYLRGKMKNMKFHRNPRWRVSNLIFTAQRDRRRPVGRQFGMFGSSAESSVFTGVVMNKSRVLNPGLVRDTVSNKRAYVFAAGGHITPKSIVYDDYVFFYPPNEMSYGIIH